MTGGNPDMNEPPSGLPAYVLKATENPSSFGIDGAWKYWVPDLFCDHCQTVYSDPYVEYPMDLPASMTCSFEGRTAKLTVPEFIEYAEALSRAAGIPMEVVPGAAVGRLSLSKCAATTDFAWATPWTPFIKRSAVSNLVARGVELRYGETYPSGNEGEGSGYVTPLSVPKSLLDDATREALTVRRCGHCGQYRKKSIRSILCGDARLRCAAWPEAAHLVRLREHSSYIVVSEAFKAACLDIGCSGVEFEPIGTWVA